MKIEKIFKNLILIDFLILIMIVISSMFQASEYSEIDHHLKKGLLSNYQDFSTALSLILFILYLITLNLLYRFVSYSKHLYLGLVVAGLLFNLFNGSVIFTSFGSILDQIGGIVTGAILILLYYSPIREYFK